MSEETKLIFIKLADIQAEVGAIAKDRENEQQHYKFRGVEDVLNMLHGLLAKHRVVVVPEKVGERHEERPSKSGGVLIARIYDIKYTAYAEDGSSVSAVVPGEGMDSGDKASNKALSGSYKYWAFLTFSIPTEGVLIDGDNGSPEPGKSQPRGNKTEPEGNGAGNGGGKRDRSEELEKPSTKLKREIGEILNQNVDGVPLFTPEQIEQARNNTKACKSLKDLEAVKRIWAAEATALTREHAKGATK